MTCESNGGIPVSFWIAPLWVEGGASPHLPPSSAKPTSPWMSVPESALVLHLKSFLEHFGGRTVFQECVCIWGEGSTSNFGEIHTGMAGRDPIPSWFTDSSRPPAGSFRGDSHRYPQLAWASIQGSLRTRSHKRTNSRLAMVLRPRRILSTNLAKASTKRPSTPAESPAHRIARLLVRVK